MTYVGNALASLLANAYLTKAGSSIWIFFIPCCLITSNGLAESLRQLCPNVATLTGEGI